MAGQRFGTPPSTWRFATTEVLLAITTGDLVAVWDGSLDNMRRTLTFSESDLANCCRGLEQRRVWLEARGAHSLFVIASNRETEYPELVLPELVERQLSHVIPSKSKLPPPRPASRP